MALQLSASSMWANVQRWKPREALLAARSQAPGLLISDVIMPMLSGIELAIQVQANLSELQSASLLWAGSHHRFS